MSPSSTSTSISMSRDLSISSFLYHLNMSDTGSEQSVSTESSPQWCHRKDVLDVLNGALSNYDDCKNAQQRSAVIKALNIDLSTLLEAEGVQLPKDLSTVRSQIQRSLPRFHITAGHQGLS
jgi:hypothetical protein